MHGVGTGARAFSGYAIKIQNEFVNMISAQRNTGNMYRSNSKNIYYK